MTGAAFYSYFLQAFKRPDKSSEVYLALADTIMDMRSRMISEDDLKVSTALTGISAIGDYVLSLPTDFGHLIGDVLIKDTSADEVYSPLNKLIKTEWDIKYNQALATSVGNRMTGVPIDYCIFAGSIYVGYPVDKTTYEFKINYTVEDNPTYTSATATIPFCDQFREVVRAGTLQRMFREIANHSESDVWGAVYVAGINNIIANEGFNREGSVTSTRYNGV